MSTFTQGTEPTLTSKSNNDLAMAARSLLRQAACPECHRNGMQGGKACNWCLERAALMDSILNQPTAHETFDDSATLTTMADKLRAIAIRDESRGLSTTGLENAAREIEWSARRDRGSEKASEQHPLTTPLPASEAETLREVIGSSESEPEHL